MAGNCKEWMKLMSVFGTIGLHMCASIFIGLGIGYYLDHKVFNDRDPMADLDFFSFRYRGGI